MAYGQRLKDREEIVRWIQEFLDQDGNPGAYSARSVLLRIMRALNGDD